MAKPRLPLVISGVDFTEAANRTAYEIEYEEREGANTVYTLAGNWEYDLLATRPVIYWPLNALWSDELAALKSAIRAATFVPVSYFDTDANADLTGYFHGSISREAVRLVTSRGRMIDGMVLTLRGR